MMFTKGIVEDHQKMCSYIILMYDAVLRHVSNKYSMLHLFL